MERANYASGRIVGRKPVTRERGGGESYDARASSEG